MKKKIVFLFVVLFPFLVNAQEDSSKTEKKLTGISTYFGINGGIDFNTNAYRIDPQLYGDDFVFTYSEINPQYNIGADISILFPFKLRPRLEFKFVKLSYEMDWGGLNSTFDKTVTKLSYFDVNLHFDYLLLNTKAFQIYVSPALKSEFLGSQKDILHYTNGDTNNKSFDFIKDEHPKSILGASASAIFKYKITDIIGVTLIPEYTFFGRNFVISNDDSYQRLSVNMGLEIEF